MLVSVIVPAFNEEKLIVRSLNCIKSALKVFTAEGWEHELIVVDNNSTDRTRELAEREGARVVFEGHNQISRARNRGAEAARGDWLIFIDADSYPGPGLLQDTAERIRSGLYIGGGCEVVFDGDYFINRFAFVWNHLTRLTLWAAGSFLFCEREAFCAVGGFREDIYVSEEIHLSNALQRFGRQKGKEFCIIRRHCLLSSGRKPALYCPRELWPYFWKLFRDPLRSPRDRDNCKPWYDGRR